MTFNTANSKRLQISVPRNKSQIIRLISLEFFQQNLNYSRLRSTELNNKDRVTYFDNVNNLIPVEKFVLTHNLKHIK